MGWLGWGEGVTYHRVKEGKDREIGMSIEVGGERGGGWWKGLAPMRR